METTKLIELAYTYFPYGLEDSSIDYIQTKEHQNLLYKLRPKPANIENLLKMGEEIVNTLSIPAAFADYSIVNKYDRCVKGRITFTEEGIYKTLGIYVSLLIPYFVIIPSVFDNDGRYTNQSYLINQEISEDYEVVKKHIMAKLEKYWPGFQSIDDNVLNSYVDNVIFDGCGRLNTWYDFTGFPPMTIFEIFFSDYIF